MGGGKRGGAAAPAALFGDETRYADSTILLVYSVTLEPVMFKLPSLLASMAKSLCSKLKTPLTEFYGMEVFIDLN